MCGDPADLNSHRIHVRFSVIAMRGELAFEQTRKIVFVYPHAQELPLLTPPVAVKDEVLS